MIAAWQVGIALLTGGLWAASLQLQKARAGLIEERKQQTRDATFRYMWDLNETVTPDVEILRSILNAKGVLSPKQARKIAGARPGDGHLWDLNQSLMAILARVEGMSIGANKGVFDLDSTWIATGPFVLTTCMRMEHFLKEIRSTRKDVFPNIRTLRSRLEHIGSIHSLQEDDRASTPATQAAMRHQYEERGR